MQKKLITLIAFILFIAVTSTAHAAIVQRYVIAGCATPGDGTTNTCDGDADDAYASLSAWEAAEQTGLVADGDNHIVTVFGGEDTTAVNISGWVTGPANSILIEAGEPHEGIWDTDKYYLNPTFSGNATSLQINETNVTVSGIQVTWTSSADNNLNGIRVITSPGTNNVIIEKVLMNLSTNTGTFSNPTGMSFSFASGTTTFRNNIIYGLTTGNDGSAVGININSATGFMYNNTVVNDIGTCYSGGDTSTEAINNIAQDCSTDFGGTWDTTDSGYNLTDGTGAPGSTGNVESTSLTFVNAASDNYHLAASDTAATDVGSDLSAKGFTDDIDGETRSSWDIGADEYFVVAAADAGGGFKTTMITRGITIIALLWIQWAQ